MRRGRQCKHISLNKREINIYVKWEDKRSWLQRIFMLAKETTYASCQNRRPLCLFAIEVDRSPLFIAHRSKGHFWTGYSCVYIWICSDRSSTQSSDEHWFPVNRWIMAIDSVRLRKRKKIDRKVCSNGWNTELRAITKRPFSYTISVDFSPIRFFQFINCFTLPFGELGACTPFRLDVLRRWHWQQAISVQETYMKWRNEIRSKYIKR